MRIINCLLIALALTACAEKSSRYKDTAQLEKPPTLAPNPQAPEDKEADTSAIPKNKDKPGLGADVYMTTDTPPKLKIKKPLGDAWTAIGQALKQSQITVSDKDHDNGTYTVKFDADNFTPEDTGLLDRSASFFKNDYDESSYVLTVKEDGSESVVTSAPENTAALTSRTDEDDKDGDKKEEKVDDKKEAKQGADLLLQSLLKTLRDDLKEE